MYISKQIKPLLYPYYMYFFLLFFLLNHSSLLFFLLYHYYFTIILIFFSIISDYIRVSHPNFPELADANSCAMRQATSGTRFSVYAGYMPGIFHVYGVHLNIHGINLVYPWIYHVYPLRWIYMVYPRIYHVYLRSIYMVYPWI